jgi:hypothetical protein
MTMRTAGLLLCAALFAAFFPQTGHAQTNYEFSYFQCDPLSCVEIGPPETIGSVLVSFNSTCTGGAIGGLNGSAKITIGIPGACKTPYVPHALVETSRTEYLDDCGDPYYVDYVTETGEVFSVSGITVVNISNESGCDGSITSPVVIGKKPC